VYKALINLINSLFSPITFVTASIVLFFICISPWMFFGALQKIGRKLCLTAGWDEGANQLFGDGFWKEKPEAFYNWLWSGKGGLTLLIGATLFFIFAATDYNFRLIAFIPDNVPIVGMLGLVGLCLWLALSQARANDARIAAGGQPLEKESSAKRAFTWPDLVYPELICMVLATAVLLVWSVFLKAPLEAPANPTSSPNPAKAPWYFLGLQELLVYFDPWIAGVLLPGLIIVGLIAIPYIDTNKKGNGYFTFKERQTEITLFLFGFVILWVLLIILGTFLRGPNWNFFGPFQTWDVHFLVPLNNINFSDMFWMRGLRGHNLISATAFSNIKSNALLYESPGIIALLGYCLLWFKLGCTRLFEKYRARMSALQFWVMIALLAIMVAVPIKMYLRWFFTLKYIITFPKYAFNI
jgi:hypothetical protein